MSLFYLFLEQQYERLVQIQVELKCIPQGDQRIRIGADIELGPRPPLHHRMMCLGFDQLKA